MAELDTELAAYRAQIFDLETHHLGKWVVFCGGQLAGLYDSFEMAAQDAVRRFGRGPYLIRQVGAPPITLPICVMYRGRDDGSSVRV